MSTTTAAVQATAQQPTPAGVNPEKKRRTLLPGLGSLWMVAMFWFASTRHEWQNPIASAAQRPFWGHVFPCMLGILGLFLCLGLAKAGRPAGILITQQNVISLSRLQTALWTMLVLGFFAGIVFIRVAAGSPDALNVAVSDELWALLGISTTSLVGTPFLLSTRRDKEPVDGAKASEAAASKFGETANDIASRAQGPLYVNPSPADARFSDIFEGDELSNTQMIDIAKVQMFVFTAVSALVWTCAALKLLSSATILAPNVALPTLPTGIVTLIGVSNAGYLLNKLVNHTPTK